MLGKMNGFKLLLFYSHVNIAFKFLVFEAMIILFHITVKDLNKTSRRRMNVDI